MKKCLALALFLAAAHARAHDGHGLSGGHWHATDTAIWVALAVAALALWWSKK